MNRLGIKIEEIEDIFQIAKKKLRIFLVMSHLSCSENKNSKINNIQLSKFITVKKKIGDYKNLKFSLANSNGILLGKSFHFDLCRPGGLIYGLNLSNLKEKKIANVLMLKAKVLDIK